MANRLPPLHALGAFVAAVRLGSLSRAAEELSVTQSAISHRISALEKWAGHKLLLRLARGVKPTPQGARILEGVTTALDVLQTSARQLQKAQSRSAIRISALPSLASHWLIPRIESFRTASPDIELDIRVTWRLARLDQDEVDIALRSGPKEWPSMTCLRLFDEWHYPVCSPAYRMKMGAIKHPKDLGKLSLLRHSRESWTPWLTKAGVQNVVPAGPVFSDAGLLLQAAAANQGIALGRHAIAEDFIKRGALVRLFDTTVSAECSYWAVTKKKRNEDKPVGKFIEWLQSEAAILSAP